MARLFFALLALPLFAAPAYAEFPCDELWGERNAIYDDAGYCFKTARGREAFDNSDCQYDSLEDVPLSARDRQKIAEIQREERRNDCLR
ncbi:YARHG domain-containing protein [Hansschlegelia quercus]|uniref:YARHG domain-containing protein n=1 Tax=Hansschlegelia quercus TaxID=2528245 RepID=A0A4Q9GND5_9HYPH|nr:YARHG domain-containing protein [Hansschlegelia quercus]TBN55001.1 YARHG domain-containing protein [Hansschlegelia quercus]